LKYSYALFSNCVVVLSFLSAYVSSLARAETGVTSEKIILGSSLPLTGNLSLDGVQRKNAMDALAKYVNSRGGVHGRKIAFEYLDDKFDAHISEANTKKLIEEKKVFALLNYVGTAASNAALALIKSNNVPLFGSITGADSLRTPVVKQVFVVRPSGKDEADQMVQYIVDELHLKDVALFSRKEFTGQSQRSPAYQALNLRGIRPVAVGEFIDHDPADVPEAFKTIVNSNAKAVILLAAGWVNEKLMAYANSRGYKPVFVASSQTDAQIAIEHIGKIADGLLTTAGYPSETSDLPIVNEFRSAMTDAGFKDSQINSMSLEAYVNGAILIEAISRVGKDLTRERLFKIFESMNDQDFKGLQLNFSPTNHQALKKVYLTKVTAGKIEKIR
jgi:branched-chain amino acid transport system substrate-binding protein